MINTYKDKCAYDKLYINIPEENNYLSNSGDIGVVHSTIVIKTGSKIKK